jgi:hypothetical protein
MNHQVQPTLADFLNWIGKPQQPKPLESSEAEAVAADLAEDQRKSERRHAVNDAAALELQLMDAMRRAGW